MLIILYKLPFNAGDNKDGRSSPAHSSVAYTTDSLDSLFVIIQVFLQSLLCKHLLKLFHKEVNERKKARQTKVIKYKENTSLALLGGSRI
jgi:hypothetical protein